MTKLLSLLALPALLSSQALAQQPAPKLLPFQARLTDQNGVAVADGAKLVQFKIYDVPTGGAPVWAGELHRTTVNGGLVNILLGSKTPFAGVDFDKTLYLEITVDVSGPGSQPDGSITAADPPMLPRQIILPAVFAKESADSRKLAGHDWTPIFGTNSPAGPLPATKLAPGSITAAQLAPKTITSNQIAPATITSSQIASGTITSNQIAPRSISGVNLASNSVAATQIATGSIGPAHLLPRTGRSAVAGVGDIATSWTNTSYSIDGVSQRRELRDLTATLTTTGRPVLLVFSPTRVMASGSSLIQVYRNEQIIQNFTYATTVGEIRGVPGVLVDVPNAGVNSYWLRLYTTDSGGFIEVYGPSLSVFEL